MADKPILFSGPMVRALLDGRKTQTRRIIKDRGDLPQFCGGRYDDKNDPSNYGWEDHDRGEWITLDQWPRWNFVPHRVGDRLWVREAHYLTDDGESEYAVYSADQDAVDEHLADMQTTMASHPNIDWSRHLRLRPSIHMPRRASRLTLIVTDVRVQRLQDISEADAIAEGIAPSENPPHPFGRWFDYTGNDDFFLAPQNSFQTLWNSINGPEAWDANPWVAAYTFTVHKQNIDQMEVQP